MSPEELEELAAKATSLRLLIIFEHDIKIMSPEAEQYLILAMAALESAASYAKLSRICLMQER